MALDPISALLDVGGKVMDRLWPDPAHSLVGFQIQSIKQAL